MSNSACSRSPSIRDGAAGLTQARTRIRAHGSQEAGRVNLPFELRQVRYAIAVAEELHFTKAAEKLHLTQPALTREIQQLEYCVGTPLFDRSTRQVQLTNAGKAFVEEAVKLIGIGERAVQRARAAGRGDPSRLQIAYCPWVNVQIPARLQSLAIEMLPDLEIDLVSLPAASQTELLLNGTLQAGIQMLPVEDASLITIRLAEEPLVLAMSESHPLAAKPCLKLEDLADAPVIWLKRDIYPAVWERFDQWCRHQGFTPRIVQEVTSLSESIGFVAEGLGISLVRLSAQRMLGDGVVARPFEPGYLLETGIAYRTAARSASLKQLLAIGDQMFASHRHHEANRGPLQRELFG